MSRHNFTAHKIYNLDATGNSTVHVYPKIICAKEIRKWEVWLQERGINATMNAVVRTISKHVPAMLILPRVHCKNHMLSGSATASVWAANKTGWSNEKLFVVYRKHFKACGRSFKEDQVDVRKSWIQIIDNSHQCGKRKWYFLAYTAAPYTT